MAEITANTGKDRKGRAMHKKSTRVDLTPMVDLGFLLITFFIVSTRLTEPGTMKLFLPKDSKDKTNIKESTVLTMITLSNNRVLYYEGALKDALAAKTIKYSTFSITGGIGEAIRDKERRLDRQPPLSRADFMLIIKPSIYSTYQSVVNALDEVAINQLPHYAMVDLDAAEIDLLFANGFPVN